MSVQAYSQIANFTWNICSLLLKLNANAQSFLGKWRQQESSIEAAIKGLGTKIMALSAEVTGSGKELQ